MAYEGKKREKKMRGGGRSSNARQQRLKQTMRNTERAQRKYKKYKKDRETMSKTESATSAD